MFLWSVWASFYRIIRKWKYNFSQSVIYTKFLIFFKKTKNRLKLQSFPPTTSFFQLEFKNFEQFFFYLFERTSLNFMRKVVLKAAWKIRIVHGANNPSKVLFIWNETSYLGGTTHLSELLFIPPFTWEIYLTWVRYISSQFSSR